jgi:hypothetical protein
LKPSLYLKNPLDGAARGIEQHQSELVVRDKDPAVLVDLEAVRPSIVLDDQLDLASGREPEDPAERNVREVEIAFAVEGGAFDEAVDLCARAVGVRPCRAALLAEFFGEAGVDLRLDPLRRRKMQHHPSMRPEVSGLRENCQITVIAP